MTSLPCNYKEGDWFDVEAADHAVRFIESYCSHVKGHSGRFILEDWQKNDIIGPLFGWKREDGRRKYRTCYVEIPRKNGKSSLTAAIALYMLCGLDERGPEIISAAGDAAQARIVFETAQGMVRQSKTLSKALNLTQYHIRFKSGWYKSISSEASTKHGYNPSGVVFDELHTQKDRELWDTMVTAVGARKEPIIIALTTAGQDTNSICFEQHEYAKGVLSGTIDDPTYLPVIYSADKDDDWTDPAVWRKANPGFGTICQEDYFKDQVNKAKQSPSHVNTFKRLNLNVWTSSTSSWITDDEFMACAGEEPPDELLETLPCYCGLDLAATRDLVAFASVWVLPDDRLYLRVHQFCNSETAHNKKLSQGVDYLQFATAGDLTITNGNVTDFDVVQNHVEAFNQQYRPLAVAFDRKFSPYIVPRLIDRDVNMVPFGQGYYEMSYPTKEMEKAYVSRQIVHDGNACLRWQMGCAVIQRDPADNIKVTKNKCKQGQMVDGIVASIMAFGEMLKDREYETTLEIIPL